jgi:prepilin-type N-terminal cleavage/methylation domain-containing protein
VRDTRSGFTLIETLAAMTVLSIIASVVLRDVVSLRADSAWFGDRSQVSLTARSVLASMLADRGLKAGVYRGRMDGRQWTATVTLVNLSSQFPGTPGPSPAGQAVNPGAPGAGPPQTVWEPQRLVIEVEAQGRPLSVETIRLARVMK